MKLVIVLCLAVALLIAIYYVVHQRPHARIQVNRPAPPKRIDQQFDCPEGSFSIRGTKDDFTINKGDRFTFRVKGGRIVSVQDHAGPDAVIVYGGDTDVIH